MLVEPDFTEPRVEVILPSDSMRPGVVDPSPLASFLREDRYVHRIVGTTGTIKFGDRLIGPAGA